MKVLILDNYDSFTWNLVHLLEQFTGEYEVHRNDAIGVEDIAAFDKIMLPPGPGLPKTAGIMMEVLAAYATTKSILGVCLGMQGIVEHFGGVLYNLPQVMHGQKVEISITDTKEPLFRGVPQSFAAGVYYSWAADEKLLPDQLIITAEDEQGTVMGIRHHELDVQGVQFHPESIMTEHGKQIIGNWLSG